MPTRSEIFVRVKPEDFGRVIKCDPSLLKNPLTSTNYPCKEFTIPSNPENGVLYLGIYCHFDGYFDGVGAELHEKFNTYEEALNLVSLGDCSFIVGSIDSYRCREGQDLFIRVCEGEEVVGCQDYLYIFENDQWKGLKV